MDYNIIEYYDKNSGYKRANVLIGSKFKSTLLSNRIMALCLSKIQTEAEEDAAGGLSLTMPGSEIQRALGSSSHAFFKDLENTAKSMTGRSVGWTNPETMEFEYTAVVTNAKYIEGKFTIEFNKNLRDYLKNIPNQYTWLELPVMLSFKSVYSFRLYEILKSKSYVPKGHADNGKYKIEIDVNELRLMLGVINAELESVQRVLNSQKGKPNYEKAVEASPEKIFNKWYELKRNCIDVAVNEINNTEITKMHVEYEPLKAGRGGKVYAVAFYVDLSEEKEKSSSSQINPRELSSKDKDDFYDNVVDLITEKLKIREIKAISEASDYNLEIIREKYEMVQGKSVDNLVGWLISAIKNDYQESKVANQKPNGFKNFNERNYDYDALLNEIIDN